MTSTWGCATRPFLKESCQFKGRNSINPNAVSHHLPAAAASLSANTCAESTPSNGVLCILSSSVMDFQLPVTAEGTCKVHLWSPLQVAPQR